ncbi:olfactory receptor 2T8-like [Microcebus murinus]|uniref:olfactory receptor 2T8-like n=1 Tax=Microcebus murinus TaxID=30608 RepID=UPI003F6C10D2
MAWAAGNWTPVPHFVLLGLSPGSPSPAGAAAVLLALLAALAGNAPLLLLLLLGADCGCAPTHFRLGGDCGCAPMHFLLGWLALADMALACTVAPRMAADLLRGGGAVSLAGCGLQILSFLTLLGDECFLLAAMAYDRYVAVCRPLRYAAVMSRRACWRLVAAAWLFGLADGLAQAASALRFPFCGARDIDHFFCEVPAVLRLACADTALYETLIYVCCVLMLLLPFAAVAASYLRILAAVLRMRSARGRRKAFATCSSHLAVVSLFYGAAMVTYMRPQAYHSARQDKVVSAFYTLVTPVLNPLIYSLRNKEVAGALRKLLGRCPRGGALG